jgi:hypothetical protein
MTSSKSSSSTGFALLYAVLLVSVVLTVGLGLSSILRKQIILSSTGAASQQAYYAANTAKECALHWGIYGQWLNDVDFQIFFGAWREEPDGSFTFTEPTADPNEIYCGGDIAIPVNGPLNSSDDSRSFRIDDFEVNGVCARATVIVRPGDTPDNLSEVVATGYNVPCDQTDNPRRVERQISGRGNFAR